MAFRIVDPGPQINPNEGLLEKGLRVGTGLATTAAKTAVDLPGNIVNTALAAHEGLGNLSDSMHRAAGFEPYQSVELLKGKRVPNVSEYTIDPAVKALLPSGYTEPQSGPEKFLHEAASDVTSFMAPIPGFGGIGSLRKSLVAAGLGGAAKTITENVTGSEGLGDAAKLTANMMYFMKNPESLQELSKKHYNLRDALLEKNAVVSTNLYPLVKELNIQNSLGISTPSKNVLNKTLDEIKHKVLSRKKYNKKNMYVDDLVELQRNLNENFPPGITPTGTAARVGAIKKELNKAFDEYGKKNPAWLKHHRIATDLYGGGAQFNKVRENLDQVISAKKIGLTTAAALFGPAIGVPKLVSGGVALLLGSKGVKTAIQESLKILNEHPAIMKLYMDTISSALKGNSVVLAKDVAKFDNAMNKVQEKRKSAGSFHIV